MSMPAGDSPEAVVQRQLDAYNAHDLDALLATYAPDARQFELPAQLLAAGHAQMRERFIQRFQDPTLHARLVKRTVIGAIVVDQEDVVRQYPEGPGRAEIIAIYEVRDGLIRSASFVFGPPVIGGAA